MDSEQFQLATKQVSSYIVDYLSNLRHKRVLPNVKPGFLSDVAEGECPTEGREFEKIFSDFQDLIVPGMTHWGSPHFHAYFLAGNSYAAVVGELLIAGINNISIHWETSPAANELEAVVLNWLGKMMNLPKDFLNCSDGPGGGVLQNTSTECTFLSLIAARNKMITKLRDLDPTLTKQSILSRLVIYSSVQSHSSVERVGSISMLTTRLLPCNENGQLTAETFRAALEADVKEGLIPLYLVATMGATTTSSWDDLEALGKICEEYDVWMHVDAAYAGAALVCPELRYISKGLEYATSFAVGMHKWFLMTLDTVAYWTRDTRPLADVMNVNRVYLEHKHANEVSDFCDLQIGTGRKFKALKVWMMLKNLGVNGVQEHIRRHVTLARYMEKLIKTDRRFDVVTSNLGLISFALKAGNNTTEALRTRINDEGKLALTPSHFNDRYVIRFGANYTTRVEDVDYAWNIIRNTADEVLGVEFKKDELIDMSIISNIDRYMDELQM